MPKVCIYIEGYGTVKIKRPKVLTPENFADSLTEAVEKTLALAWGGDGFHPAMGYLLKEDK